MNFGSIHRADGVDEVRLDRRGPALYVVYVAGASYGVAFSPLAAANYHAKVAVEEREEDSDAPCPPG